jgi:hypothetical protein
MTDKKTSVFAIYSDRSMAEKAVSGLMNVGFAAADISVLLPENPGNREIGTEKNTKAPEGATTGAGNGCSAWRSAGTIGGIGALAIRE